MRLTALAGMWPWVRAHCPHDANERVQPSYGTKGHHILTSSIISRGNKQQASCVLTPGFLRGAVWTKRRCQKRISAKSSSRQPSNRRAGTSPLGTRHHQRMTCRLDGSGDQQSASIHDQRAVLRNFDTKYVASPCPICSDSYIFCSI